MFGQKASISPSEVTVSCPFNPSHRFIAAKLVFHLNKCKDRERMAHLFEVCPYNKTHWIKRSQYKLHLKICKNKNDVKDEQIPNGDSDEEIRKELMKGKKVKCEQQNKQKDIEIEKPTSKDLDDCTLSDCQECQSIMNSPIFEEMINSSRKLKKYMDRYRKLNLQEEQLAKMRQKEK